MFSLNGEKGDLGTKKETQRGPKSTKRSPRGRDKKNLQNSEYSGFRLFGRIEWVPPLKTKKHLRVMRRTGKQPWGIFY